MDDEQFDPQDDPNAGLDATAEGDEQIDAAPDDEAPPISEEPEVDWRARAERAEAEAGAARQREQSQLAAAHYAQFQAAWDQAETQANQQAEGLDWEQARDYLNAFHRERRKAENTYAAQIISHMSTQGAIDSVVREFGLKAEDREFLIGQPNVEQMRRVAHRLRTERDEIDQRFAALDKRITQTQRQQAARTRQATGADRVGGLRGGATAPSTAAPGSLERLAEFFPEYAMPRR